MSEVKERALRPEEKNLAWQVYRGTLPYDRIMIGNEFGLGDRAFMDARDMPGWGTGDYYVLQLGEVGYLDATSGASIYGKGYTREVKTVFIHELAHVWQSYRGMMPLASSILNQGCYYIFTLNQISPYDYTSGGRWCTYNVEQQASIVEQWFTSGMKEDDDRFDYIRDHVRVGKQHSNTCNHGIF